MLSPAKGLNVINKPVSVSQSLQYLSYAQLKNFSPLLLKPISLTACL